jgi:hypothetical protein
MVISSPTLPKKSLSPTLYAARLGASAEDRILLLLYILLIPTPSAPLPSSLFFQQVSFVNSICTIRGGTHVEHVSKQVVKIVQEAITKKNKGGAEIKPSHVKNHLWVFVKALIENPAFDSQTKETLTTKVSDFGSKCTLTDDFLKKGMREERKWD